MGKQDDRLPALPPAVQNEIRELFDHDRSLKELGQKYKTAMSNRDYFKMSQIGDKIAERHQQLIDVVVRKYEQTTVSIGEATRNLSEEDALELKARLDYLFLIVDALDSGIVEFNAMLHRIGRREIITQFDEVQKACKPIKAQIQYCFKDSSDFYIKTFDDTSVKLYKLAYEKAVQLRKRIIAQDKREEKKNKKAS